MRQLIEYKIEGSETVLVEVEVPEVGIERAGRTDEVIKAAKTFDEALEPVRPVAQHLIAKLRSLAEPPEEIGVAFGIKLSAKIGAIIACADTEANFTVTLTWKRSNNHPQLDVHANSSEESLNRTTA